MGRYPAGILLSLIFLSLGGCLGGDEAPRSQDPVDPVSRWTSTPIVELPSSGVYLVPYIANSTVDLELSLWMDGGTWKGIHAWILPKGQGVQYWGALFEMREYASHVFEDRRAGEYRIDCLGQTNGSFCEPYNNTVDRGLPLNKLENHAIFSRVDPLPAGHNYLLIQASFDKLFRLKMEANSSMWVGEPTVAGEEIRFAPEYFRGNHVDIARCLSILWCGHVVDGEWSLERNGWDSLMIDLYGSVGTTVPYFEVCLSRASEDIQCHDRNTLPVGSLSFPVSLQWVMPYEEGLFLRSDVVAIEPPERKHSSGWIIGGAIIWFNMPTDHPGPRERPSPSV